MNRITYCPQCDGTSWDTSGRLCLFCGYVIQIRKDKIYCAECLKFGKTNEIPCKLHKGGMGEEK